MENHKAWHHWPSSIGYTYSSECLTLISQTPSGFVYPKRNLTFVAPNMLENHSSQIPDVLAIIPVAYEAKRRMD